MVISNSNLANVYSLFIIFSKMHSCFLKIFKMTIRESPTVSIKWISRRKQLGKMLELQRGDRFRQTVCCSFFFPVTKHRQTQCFEKQTDVTRSFPRQFNMHLKDPSVTRTMLCPFKAHSQVKMVILYYR